MYRDSQARRVRREMMVRFARLHAEGVLEAGLDRIPVEMVPRDGERQPLRCCPHAERAILRQRLQALMGCSPDEGSDDVRPLSAVLQAARARRARDPRTLAILQDACSACQKSSYFVTDACRGCMAQPCAVNCPKEAIHRINGRAVIDPDRCVNCGRCLELCAFRAIVPRQVPCEESCPVDAIRRGENGRQELDHARCIHCGRCMSACPFGAVVEVSEYLEVLDLLRAGGEVVALPAPALYAQFQAAPEQVTGALRALGFTRVVEVAAGADLTAAREAEELVERLEGGAPFMTTSCCPAYVGLATEHLTALAPRVSHTPSPMRLAAELAAQRFPGARRVFIGPCVAKRDEAMKDALVDHVLSIEEISAAWVAAGIDVAAAQPSVPDVAGSGHGRGFAAGGGVRDAVLARLGTREGLEVETVAGFGREGMKTLRLYGAGKGKARFLECMACEGGCIGGPDTLAPLRVAERKLAALRTEGAED